MDAFQILVIILSIFLAIFLILGIFLLIMFIRISIKIKHAASKLDDAANNVMATTETIKASVENLSRLASPAVIAKIVVKYIRNRFNKTRRENE